MEMRLVLFVALIGLCNAYIRDPGPRVIATRGEVWPKPQTQEKSDNYYVIRPSLFRFRAIGQECQLLTEAMQRYWEIISRAGLSKKVLTSKFWSGDSKFFGYIDILDVFVTNPCEEWPYMGMDEKYVLNITESTLKSDSIWGALRGLETFAQLVHVGNDETTLVVNATAILDYPRFGHRGLLIDTSRHFIPKYSLLQMIDAMAYNKMNVFHWHVTDDESFPFQSITFPELSDEGAYHPVSKIFSVGDVTDVIEYARRRGIRVIPEFDTPGHTRSWGVGVPELLTPCHGEYEGKFGPMDPTREFVYSFLSDFLAEVKSRFHDNYIHLGADEVEFECWESNQDISSFMQAHNITGDYVALETYFIQRLIGITNNLSYKSIVWEEVFTNKVNITTDTIIHVWKTLGYKVLMDEVTKAGFPLLLSSCWYLDHLESGGDWKKYYDCEPLDFNGTPEQEKLVLGGEACMWTEVVNEYNIGSRIWPRASATAEKLWSAKDADIYNEAAKRLEEHTCRMNSRGISSQPPNSAGVCL